jgi:hypothetical protein
MTIDPDLAMTEQVAVLKRDYQTRLNAVLNMLIK